MTNTVAFGSAAHRQSQVLDLVRDGMSRVFVSGEGLFTAVKALRRSGHVTMTALGGGRFAVKITAKGLASLTH